MFHIHTFDGIQHNVPLESLHTRLHVKRVNENATARKTISNKQNSDNDKLKTAYSRAARSYRESIDLKDEHVELLYAYSIMSKPVITIKPGLSVIEAWDHYNYSGVNHMPVIDEQGGIIGVLSDRDLLKHLIIDNGTVENSSPKTVMDIMTRDVITASSVTDIRRIARVLFDHHIGTMPVLDPDHRLAGIITRSDILYALIHYPALRLWA